MLFSNADAPRAAQMADDFDQAFKDVGGIKNDAKDVTNSLGATCVGVDLVSGTHLHALCDRCLFAVQGVIDLSDRRVASPKEVHQFLGVLQCYNLLCRPKLAVYDAVYDFVRSSGDDERRVVPTPVIRELLISVALAIFRTVGLRRPFAPFIGASDASTEFGFGMSIQRCLPSQAESAAKDVLVNGSLHFFDHGARADA